MSFVPLWVAVILNSCIVFDDRMKVVITTGYPLLTNRIKAVMGKMSNACLFIIVTFGNTKSVHVWMVLPLIGSSVYAVSSIAWIAPQINRYTEWVVWLAISCMATHTTHCHVAWKHMHSLTSTHVNTCPWISEESENPEIRHFYNPTFSLNPNILMCGTVATWHHHLTTS
jgi:hypothetical protein